MTLSFKNLVVYLLVFVALAALVFTFAQKPAKHFFHSFDLVSKTGTLFVEQEKITSKEPISGLLCVNNAIEIKMVDLFMPDMGHGSAPPKYEKIAVPEEFKVNLKQNQNYGCLKMTDMQMFMGGLWQVRVFFNDETIDTFDINVSE